MAATLARNGMEENRKVIKFNSYAAVSVIFVIEYGKWHCQANFIVFRPLEQGHVSIVSPFKNWQKVTNFWIIVRSKDEFIRRSTSFNIFTVFKDCRTRHSTNTTVNHITMRIRWRTVHWRIGSVEYWEINISSWNYRVYNATSDSYRVIRGTEIDCHNRGRAWLNIEFPASNFFIRNQFCEIIKWFTVRMKRPVEVCRPANHRFLMAVTNQNVSPCYRIRFNYLVEITIP